MKTLSYHWKNFTNIRYADDTAILASSTYDLQRMFGSIVRVSRGSGIQLIEKKITVMVIGKKPEANIKIIVNGKQLEKVKYCNYLGTNVSDDGKWIKKVKVRITLAKTAFWK